MKDMKEQTPAQKESVRVREENRRAGERWRREQEENRALEELEMISEEEMEADDLRELAKEVGKLSPVEYAKLRGIRPQLVFYHIRKGHIEKEWCICGRRVIDVARADKALQANKEVRRRTGGTNFDSGDAEGTDLVP